MSTPSGPAIPRSMAGIPPPRIVPCGGTAIRTTKTKNDRMSQHVKTKTEITVSTWTTALTYATNQTISMLMRYANQRGLDTNYLSRKRDMLEDGIYTWLCTRHLDTVYLEVYDPDTDTVEERFDLGFDHEEPGNVDEETARQVQEQQFESLHSRILEQVKDRQAPPDGAVYRVVVDFKDKEDEPPEVDGWSPTSLRDVDHLQREDLGDWLDAGAVNAGASIWINDEPGPGVDR